MMEDDIVNQLLAFPDWSLCHDAAKEIEQLRTNCERWKKVADLFGRAYTTDKSGQFVISDGSDLFRAVMAYEKALRSERNNIADKTTRNMEPPR